MVAPALAITIWNIKMVRHRFSMACGMSAFDAADGSSTRRACGRKTLAEGKRAESVKDPGYSARALLRDPGESFLT